MKKKVFSLMMTFLLAFMGVAKADVVEIGSGTTTNSYVPTYEFYNYSLTQQIYTAAEIGTAGTINSIAFYTGSSATSATRTFTVYMVHTNKTAFSGANDWVVPTAADQVFSGSVTYTSAGWTTITLDTPFEYNGTDNLCLIVDDNTGGYVSSISKYVFEPGGNCAIRIYSDGTNYNALAPTSYSGTTLTVKNQLHLDITPNGGGGQGGFEDKLHVKYENAEGEEIIDSLNLGVRPAGYWMEPFQFTMYSEGPTYTVNVLDFTPSDGMFTVEGEELPFQVAPNADVDLVMGTNENAPAGLIERQFVAITEGDRAAHIWPVVVELYAPEVPDVWELPCEEATTFPFVEVPATAHNTELHNDYTLPFPEIPEGYDAVYKLVFAHDVMLNASVTSGENGKVALYRDGFEGEGGPMATNYYVGPQVGGGSGAAGYEAMIGDETTTTSSTYFPFHSLWNYSLAENLFLASELTEAGVTTAPMTSLSWYVLSTSCTTPQNNINIWMANVSDEALTSTSHTTAGMTLVYSGSEVLPVAGQWNEFVFNAGNFAWDGHSNILILCQRQNGSYQGSISWQTHNPGFAGMCYAYTDNAPGYDATTQTYSMYTSTTNRPNIIMKGGSRRDVAGLTSPSRHESGAGHPGARINPNAPAFTPSHNGIQAMLRGSNAYGMQCYGSGATPSMSDGLVNFDVDDFAGTCSLVTSDYYSGGVAYNPNTGHYYIGDYSGYMFYEVDLASGTVVNSMPTYYGITSLCYNAATDELYGLDSDGYVFYIINPASIDYSNEYLEDDFSFSYGDELDIYANEGRFPYDLTIGPDGQLYTIVSSTTSTTDDALMLTVDPYTGTTTTVANLNVPAWYFQGLEYDANTGVFVWAQEEETGGTLYTINPSTYAVTEVYEGIGEVMGLCIPASGAVLPEGIAYGPEIINAAVEAGTYYLVASSTDADFEVTINAEDMPCPTVDAEGFVWGETPADDADEIEPASVTLRWNIPAYATGWRLVFGSTYYPDPNHPQTIMYPEDGSFATELANSYTVHNLWNNTNYFWHVEFNNDGCPEGVSSPIFGFTTHLNIPTNLTAEDYTIFNDEHVVLHWNAVVDRTFRTYYIYRNGVKVGETTVNNIADATFTDELLAYNMDGYVYYVTAVYDEGESAPSDPVTVKVSGRGNVNGHVYEQDGETGIAGATVTMVGQDEFGDNHTYNFTTDANGYYSGAVYVGNGYDGQAAKEGYQTDYEPEQGEPIVIVYNQTTSPVDYIMDENFDPVCGVIAEYYPDSLDPNSPYVKVYWGCGLPGSEIIEPFETGDFSLFDWQVDPTYPWSITTTNPYEGTYCMKSGGAGVANVVSNMTVTVNIPADGLMSFFGKISCESSWDYGYFFIDGVQKGSYTGAGNWAEKVFDITAGDHTFQWRYTKDGSVNSNDDCFYVDYITFYKQPAPPVPGMTYDFEDHTMQGWTSVDADGDGYGWRVGSEVMTGVAGHNSSEDFVFSQSYDNSYGVLYPDNYLVSPQVQLGGIVRFYACAQDAGYAAEHFGVAVSTTNTNPSSFTMVQEWTMSAKSMGDGTGKPIKGQRSGREQGNWYEYTVDLSAYSGNGYVAIRHFNCSDMFYLDVDDITIGEPGKGIAETRSLDHYRVYRTNCYNDGPYTPENTVLLATVWVPDTVYIDVEWADLAPGVYKWGVGAVYSGNRGEEIEGEINWSEPVTVNNNRDMTVDFESGMPAGWTVIDANNDGWTWTLTSDIPTTWTYYSSLTLDWYHGGSNAICSGSYINGVGALNPDEYLVSPQVNLGAGSSISFWVAATDASYAADHFGVFVSDNGTSNWTSVQEWTLTGSKSGLMGGSASRDGEGLRLGTWFNYTVDLSAFDGQKYVAFRHFNCYDQYIMCLDDITIVEGAGGPTPPTPPTPGSNELQLPRESEIVWSNCLDKDMYLDHVSVNVLLNSADSPEGTEVTFTNLNEFEQANYGGYNVTLDGSGYYLWDSFRRGDYAVKVEHIGYEPIADTVSIWATTDLRYVMTEIIYGVENVYVSRTGWAMWDPLDPQQGGSGVNPTPGPSGNYATSFTEDFEGGLSNWTIVDADGDGHVWNHSSQSQTYSCYDYTGWGHNSTNGFAYSQSYTDCTYDSYDPNNFMITNTKYSIVNGSTLNFWADYGNDSYPDHFGVAVATVDNPTPADFTMVWEGSAKAGNGKASVRHDENRYQNWRSHSVDLSAYAGQDVYIAFRHFNSYDQYEVYIDDVELTAGAKNGGERHLEHYKVMCTSIDGVPIFNHNTVYPFCQLSTNEPYNAPLVEGEHYLCKVAVMYSTGLSEWSEPVEWVYEPCDHWGPVDAVEVNTTGEGNHIEWVFEHGFNPYANDTVEPGPQPGTGDWYYYDNGVNVDAIGTGGGNFYWGVMFPAGSYTGNTVTKVSAYDYMAMTGNVTIYTGGTTAPGTAVGQTNVTFTGSEDFVEFEFAAPVAIDPSQNVWVVFYNGSGATYPAAVCDNTGDANGRWVSIDGTDWMDLVSAGLDNTFMVRAYIASGRGTTQQVNVYGNGEGGSLAISGNGPRVKNAESMDFVMTSENTAEFNIGNMANYDGRVYFLHKLVNDSRFSVINAEQGGVFIVSANGNINLKDSFADFVEQTTNDFARMDKYAAADYASQYKGTLPMAFVNSMMNDLYVRSRENNMCEFADPFCTDNGMYEFPAGVNAGSGETGPDYDCLYTQPNPAWYYMRIGDPGAMDIHMYSTPEVDIDFCCWGPFEDPTTPCPNGLTEDKVVSCSYSTSWTEHCMIPATAQTGEYYILVITNYSNQPCNINFSMVDGAGSTDCGILPPVDILGFLITMDGEYLAFAEPTAREFMHEGEFGEHEYCVRPIYPGEMVLPDHNYGWSMGCPVCATPSGDFCAPVTNLVGEYRNIEGMEGLYIDWEEPEGAVSFILYLDGEQTAEVAPGEHPLFIALPSGFPAFTLNVGVVAVYEDCVSEMQQVDIFYDDVIENEANVALFPNPTSGNVTIQAEGMTHITVASIIGQVVYDADVNANEMTINMGQFNAGMYMVRINTANGVVVKRITVMQ